MSAEPGAGGAVATDMSTEPGADRAVATGMFAEPGAGATVATGMLAKFSEEDMEGMAISASAVRAERIPVCLAVGTLIEVSSATVATGVVGVIMLLTVGGGVVLRLFRTALMTQRTVINTTTTTRTEISTGAV